MTSSSNDTKHFRQIGKGQCGTVYAIGQDRVTKLPNSTVKADELFQDARIHELVIKAIQCVRRDSHIRIDINVPGFTAWLDPTSQPFWRDTVRRFDARSISVPNYGLISDQIHPLHLETRRTLVDTLYPRSTKDQKLTLLNRQENSDCLVRLYLGRREVDRSKLDHNNITLRNFPLHIDEMKHFKLDTKAYAEVMAQTLAVMHWKAGIDANDVEFVLGSAPEFNKTPQHKGIQNETMDTAAKLYNFNLERRSIGIWLLDFNQCSTFSDDAAGLKKIVDSFWWNDPYYPRPNSTNLEDKELWEIFAEAYLALSSKLTESPTPQMFIQAIKEQGNQRSLDTLFG